MHDRETLERQDIEAIRQLLLQRGANYHHKEKKETLINRYLEISNTTQPSDKKRIVELQDDDDPEPPRDEYDIYDVLKPWIERGLQLDVTDNYFTMTFGKRQDSGNLHYSKGTVIRTAQLLTGYHGRD